MYLSYDSASMKLKIRQNQPTLVEVRTVLMGVGWGQCQGDSDKKHEGTSEARIILFLDLSAGYKDLPSL